MKWPPPSPHTDYCHIGSVGSTLPFQGNACTSYLLIPLLVLTSVPLNPSRAALTLASTSTSSVLSFLSHLPIQIHVHCPAAQPEGVSNSSTSGQNCHQRRSRVGGRSSIISRPLSQSQSQLRGRKTLAHGAPATQG